ncbi:Nif3-like dinuclear metal center hexameric protein [Desulforamulus aeronauticus]|uniref:GTP cyclohydrolase 1 type 2 homolog n=1 Tax=Desulforamulus aeronauticus DSM 10349 TaxID=1121421 RepID=A0A1M6VGK2_9FIRM|nr:Nif3-like dinuclear metal center hexameric protein [Desulforamulus aeronauticus]SHK80589.1 dinuclear metal center protein, YbgI/SA1388 family [Desulforamulus aeronauticus DSM 10349]
MTVIAQEITNLVEEMAPRWLAEEWDNSGWQIGNPRAEVSKVLLALDVDAVVVREAQEKNANLIICHHPMLMKGIKNIRLDEPRGALIAELIQHNIGVYAAHTNLDSAIDGVNTILARRLGLEKLEIMHPSKGERYLKLAVFVPVEQAEAVRQAICQAGAGWIGKYSDCTFQTTGSGSFRPLEGTNPFKGRQGQVERVDEIKLETIVPGHKLKTVLNAMLEAHPYEEVAYDLYPLENHKNSQGLGRIGELKETMSFADLIIYVKEALGLATVKVGGGMWRDVRRVAVCGGSGSELWSVAAAKGAEVLITGDIKYHTAQDMLTAGISFIDAGHFATEHLILPQLQNQLEQASQARDLAVEFMLTKRQSDPFMYI